VVGHAVKPLQLVHQAGRGVSFDEVAARVRDGRALLRQYPELAAVPSQVGGTDEEAGAPGSPGVEFCLPLRPRMDWPAPEGQGRPRTAAELGEALREHLGRQFPGVDWSVAPDRRGRFWEPFRARRGEGLVKVFGPDLEELEQLAGKLKEALAASPGVEGVGISHVLGRPRLQLGVDRAKCAPPPAAHAHGTCHSRYPATTEPTIAPP
jgi:cobalt-zinc-cadmium resistance protein CzcA